MERSVRESSNFRKALFFKEKSWLKLFKLSALGELLILILSNQRKHFLIFFQVFLELFCFFVQIFDKIPFILRFSWKNDLFKSPQYIILENSCPFKKIGFSSCGRKEEEVLYVKKEK